MSVFCIVFHLFPNRIFFSSFFSQIFGNSVTDVAVSNGILIVMYSIGLVRLYNFQAISEQVMKYEIFRTVHAILEQ